MAESTVTDPGDLEQLLEYVKRSRDYDFTGYKRPTLARRIAKRMAEVHCTSYVEYEDYLEVHPDEFVTFFNTILINVTSFFRDPQAWEFVAEEIVPRIVSGKDPGEPIRVWSAGCASGEEAYTLAMVLCEALGQDQFRSRVKVYGTDVDEEALAQARAATYDAKAMEAVPEPLRERYFETNGRGATFRADLRRAVIFGRHDLLRDAPISRLDLLACRNTLMYFNSETQSAILDRFRFALDGGGYLFLGRAETLLSHSTAFRPLQLRLRVFESIVAPKEPRGTTARTPDPADAEWPRAKLRDAAFDTAIRPMLVVDVDGTVQAINAAARTLFGIGPQQMGRPLQDLEMSYRPLELRSVVDEAYRERGTVERRGIEWAQRDDMTRVFDVVVTPLFDRPSGSMSGVSISFDDVTRFLRLEAELERSTAELQTAYEELQSTNEELETMNEELQSTNDEFQVVNDMLNARGAELDRVNVYLQSVLTGINSGVIVVDQDLAVQVWNHWSEDLWGLRSTEVEGKHLLNLDIGLTVTELLPTVRAALDGDDEIVRVELPARNRRGRDFVCSVSASSMTADGKVVGAILLMDDVEARERASP